ncbi:hypothetical protein FHS31_003079 [Sphingomonas vulcanisoli]|uniref:Glycosyltransferase 2-like domain-containing protein n=1 Tax=Sphingomonas vulcanisoli TaxID=1658060 RepID=A0ABX0TY87_9SPHN|nr:glycosyltransferase family 2 protein [Sphingomonas vulcanisoli]NIJ09447.1 hypothetical protein [Sphingomonas vulcanisoli]
MPSSQPFLSILIPSYNRARFVKSLVTSLAHQIERDDLEGVEIVIADNASNDDTAETVTNLAARWPFVRLYTQPTHFGSAEKNIFTAVGVCRGKYAWTISDDDHVSDSGIKFIINLLKTRAPAFALLNVSLFDTLGNMRHYYYIPQETGRQLSDNDDLTLRDLIETIGFLGLLTSISSAIFEIEPVRAIDLLSIIEKSEIYSHSAVYMQAFGSKKTIFVPQPIVNVYDDEGLALDKISFVSASSGKQRMYSWTIGLARLIEACDLDVGKIWEVTPTNRILLGDLITSYMCDQITLWLDSRLNDQVFTDREVDIVLNALAATSSTRLVLTWNRLRQIGLLLRPLALPADKSNETFFSTMAALPTETYTEFIETLNNYARETIVQLRGALSPDLIGTIEEGELDGYRISRRGTQWIAEHAATATSVSEPLQTGEHYPDRLVAGSRQVLEARILGLVGNSDAKKRTAKRLQKFDKSVMPPAIVAAADWIIAPEYLMRASPEARAARTANGAEGLIDFWIGNVRNNIVPSPLISLPWFRHNNGQLESRPGPPTLEKVVTIAIPSGLPFCPVFDEHWYLATYTDATHALSSGEVETGFEHYMRFGGQRGYDPCAEFDEEFYLASHPDARRACGNGLYRSGAEHYMAEGAMLGYNPSRQFSEAEYLVVNADVGNAVRVGVWANGFLHWLAMGKKEGRAIAHDGRTFARSLG